MRNCDHDFIRVNTIDTDWEQAEPSFTIIVCAYCGQVRHLDETGGVKIVKEGGVIKP